MPVSSLEVLAGVGLDLALGDPQWMPHPVRAIGWLAVRLEKFWRWTRLPLRMAGLLFWISVSGIAAGAVWLTLPWAAIYWIYALLACRDLDVEASRAMRALAAGDLEAARHNLSWIVGRDTAELDGADITRASIETVAENLSDGVIAPLFWLALGGPVAMMIFKASSTLDSMVGYRTREYREFGWASARIDDLLNLVPARITALLVWGAALLPGFRACDAVRITLRDGGNQPSPNSGYPEAAFAGALGVQLGGLNFYKGIPHCKNTLGDPAGPLDRHAFTKTRVLLYACEALCVAGIVGVLRWLQWQ